MDNLATVLAVVLGLILKHVVAPNWSGFTTKAIPVIVFMGTFIYALIAQLGIPMPYETILEKIQPAANTALGTTLVASGVQSTSKNVFAQWIFPWFKKGKK